MIKHDFFFIFGIFLAKTVNTPVPCLLKYIVMGLLCYATVVTYIQKNEIWTIKTTMHAFDYIAMIKNVTRSFVILVYFRSKLAWLPSLTFKINGHGAFVWCHCRNWLDFSLLTFEIKDHGASVLCHCSDIYIKERYYNNLDNHERIWLYSDDKHNFLRF